MLGWEHLQDAEHGAAEPVGGSGLQGTLPTGHRGEQKSPFFGHFCPGFVVLPFPASSELWVAQRG